MTSIRNSPSDEARPTSESALLEAARASILAVGWKRTTLTDVARRAGVSRMTIYRTWPDMDTLLADLMTREWEEVVATALTGRDDTIATVVTAVVAALRDNPLFAKIVEVDPEVLLPYLLHRRGRSQQAVLDLLRAGLERGQADGTVRDGDPERMARAILLAAQGFTLSAATMTGPEVPSLDDELTALIERYTAP